MLGLSKEELAVLKKLSTPQKIQDYLDALPQNFEENGETYRSPRRVLRDQTAHCIEGALLAAVALWLQGERPLLLDLKTFDIEVDSDHVVAIYKTVRELALSYFHEYFLVRSGEKTLRSYSRPVSLKRFGTKWITAEEDLSHIAEALDMVQHFALIPKGHERHLRPASPVERKASSIPEWSKENLQT